MVEVLSNKMLERELMDKKRISVSSKRQITIPQKFFEKLGIAKEVDCFMKDGMLQIKPIRDEVSNDFAEEILQDLVEQGFSGPELIARFKEVNKKVRPAIKCILDEADKAALNLKGTGDDKFNDMFGMED